MVAINQLEGAYDDAKEYANVDGNFQSALLNAFILLKKSSS